MIELPVDFPHTAPDGFRYEVTQPKRNTLAIWLCHPAVYSYTNDPVKTIWGFVKTTGGKRSTKTTYHAPINSNKVGEVVDIKNTRPWTAMKIHYKGLQQFFKSNQTS